MKRHLATLAIACVLGANIAQAQNTQPNATPAPAPQPGPAPVAEFGKWKLQIVGAGNIFYKYDDHGGDEIKGENDALQMRRTYVDVIAEKKSDKGIVTGAKVRFWLEPVAYNDKKFHMDGFGADDTRAPLEFINELEGYIKNIPLDEGKNHLISIVAGKGYVRFGFDRPEEQAPFSEFPLIHPTTKAGGLGQVMHLRVTYKNTALGLEIDTEVFEPATPDSNYFDIDLPDSFGHGQAISVRKNLPIGLVAMASVANMSYADGSESVRYATGLKYNKDFGANKDYKLQVVVEYSLEDKTTAAGKDLRTKGFLAQGMLTKGKNTFALRYGSVNNPARPATAREFMGQYSRKLVDGKRLKISGFVEGGRVTGARVPGANLETRSSKQGAVGIRFNF